MPPSVCSLGFQHISWIEHHLVHGPGDVQGQPIELDEELCAFLVKAGRVDGRSGQRRYDEVFFSRSKGRSKSELAGMLVCVEFVGPARFDHWAEEGERLVCDVCDEVVHEFELGEPVGRSVTYPFIRCLATEEGQSGNTYDNVTTMLEHLVETHGTVFPRVDLGQRSQTSTRVFLEGGGEIRPSTASSASKDGGKETFSVFDETHLYTTPDLRRMYDVVSRNGRKRKAAQPWILQTSTMYGKGEDSIAERTHRAYGVRRTPRMLFDHREAPADLDPEKLADRIAGLRHCYGPFHTVMPVEAIAADYDDPRVDRNDWLRYWWNRATAGTSDLVDAAHWDTLAREDQLRPGDLIGLGFDGSRSDDSTALIAVRLSDMRAFAIKVWERPMDAPPGWRVPRDDVDATMGDVYSAYRVTVMFGDPNKWEPYFDLWEARWPKRVAEEWPSDKSTDRKVRAMLTMLKDGSLTHNGDAALSRHVKNTVVTKGRLRPASDQSDDADLLARNYLGLGKKGAGKIDAAWALMLAIAAAGWSIEHGALTPVAAVGFYDLTDFEEDDE